MVWVIAEEEDAYHVIPVGDVKPHDISCNCWCIPMQDKDRSDVWVHMSLDGREKDEERTVH